MKYYEFGTIEYQIQVEVNGDFIKIETLSPYYQATYRTTLHKAEETRPEVIKKIVDDYITNNDPEYRKSWECD